MKIALIIRVTLLLVVGQAIFWASALDNQDAEVIMSFIGGVIIGWHAGQLLAEELL